MNNSKNFNLIVPVAADKAEYDGRLPHVFTPWHDGILLCLKAITGLNIDVFDAIYFTILRKHVASYDVDQLLRLQFNRLGIEGKAKIVILENATNTQAETIVRTIEKENISGAIFIKDADCYFRADAHPENGIAVFPLENLDLVDPRNKSYVAVDDMQHITNIIEKRVVSHLFNAGGYCFENVTDFLDTYNAHRHLGHVYLSHLIYAMLLDGHSFRPIPVTEYNDCNIR